MLYTSNFELRKLQLSDSPPNIEDLNPNWDEIDAQLQALYVALDGVGGFSIVEEKPFEIKANILYFVKKKDFTSADPAVYGGE